MNEKDLNDLDLKTKLAFLGKDLLEEILEHSRIMEVPKETVLLKSGQYVKILPVVLSGLVKVFSKVEEKELLLYYLTENETCIMSYMACLKNKPSKVMAKTEEDSVILAIPFEKVNLWSDSFPSFNKLVQSQYDKRYIDLLDTINHLIFEKLDIRVYEFLKMRSKVLKKDTIKITHKQIASELGTAREVVSRIVKKLEIEDKIKMDQNGIFIVGEQVYF